MDPNQLLDILDQARDGVAALTGIKQQLIESGWEERAAEQVVIAMLNQGNGGSQ